MTRRRARRSASCTRAICGTSETGEHGAAAALFDRAAGGVTTHAALSAWRHAGGLTPSDVEANGTQATATFHAEAEVCEPLAATCTAAQMARLQGNVASRHWQSGRFDAHYVKGTAGWKIADLRWSAT